MSDNENPNAVLLKRLPIFSEIEDEDLLQTLARHFKRSTHHQGHVLAREGQPQPAMFVIESGKVTRTKGGVTVDELGKETVTGMLHLFDQDPSFATLECQQDTVVWSLSAKEFHQLLGSDERLAAKLLAIFSKQLRENSKLLRQAGTSAGFTVAFFDFKPYEKGPFEAANQRNKNESQSESDDERESKPDTTTTNNTNTNTTTNTNNNTKYTFKYCPERLSIRTVSQAAGADAVCIFVNDHADAKVVEELKRLGVKMIALRCAGYNNVDLKACKLHGLQVVRVPAYSPYAVAEHAMGLILTLNRKLHKAYNRTREGNFALQGLLGFDIHGKTVGVLGTGKIGICLIDILVGFGCKVLCYDVRQSDEVKQKRNTKYVDSVEELLSRADIISLHLPLLDSTKHIINSESISKMKRGVMIINTSRGGLIDTSALISGLKSGQVGYAGLDVYEEEEAYFFEDHSDEVISDSSLARLFTFPNVVVTGHQAFFTINALDNIAQTTVKNIDQYVEGKAGEDHPNNVKAEYS